MPFNGSGVFTPKHNWEVEAASGTPILPERFDDQEADFAAGLSNTITRDGQSGPAADIPWNNYGITGLRAPVSALEAANKAYVDTANSDRSMGGYKLTNVGAPVAGTDAVNYTFLQQYALNAALPNQAGKAGCVVRTDGTNAVWSSVLPNMQKFTSSATWVATTDTARLTLTGGGGSSGANGQDINISGGGAGGATAIVTLRNLVIGATYTLTIGAAGAAVTVNGTQANGNAGGTSSFSGPGIATVTATGGAGGSAIGGTPAGGTATNCDIAIPGGRPIMPNNSGLLGGSSFFAPGAPFAQDGTGYGEGGGPKGGVAGGVNTGTKGGPGVAILEY